MYKKNKVQKTTIKLNDSYEGETLEAKIRRILNNKEPISDNAEIIYTDRKDGIQAAYDIRTDRFELAVEAMDVVTKSGLAKRDMRIGERTYDTMSDEQKTEFHKKYPNSKIKAPAPAGEGGA